MDHHIKIPSFDAYMKSNRKKGHNEMRNDPKPQWSKPLFSDQEPEFNVVESTSDEQTELQRMLEKAERENEILRS